MEYIFPDVLLEPDSTWPPSSILYWPNTSESNSTTNLISTLLIHVANEAAERDLRTVYILPDPLDKTHLVHLHGARPLDMANWENIHFLHLTTEQSLIHWLSNVHLGKRFADLIIVDSLEKYLKLHEPSYRSSVLRLTGLFEETRMFVHGVTRADEHGHDCRLIVACGLPESAPTLIQESPTQVIPPHSLSGTYILVPQGPISRFRFSSLEQKWALDLETKHGELFWSHLIPAQGKIREPGGSVSLGS